ncbi:MAG: rod shape-determining protein MreD [Chloroflexi bacterium]|nr:rod shape-determining protein MreD [Chloroflexota bacterium]
MSLLLSAIGATIVAVLDVTLGRYLTIGNAAPHLVLVLGVIWSIAAGIEGGVAWAFVGGIVLDSLLGRPLGASAFALLVAMGGARLIAQPMARLRLVVPIVAVPILSLVYSMLILVLGSTGQGAGTVADPIGLFMPGVIYDAVLGIFLGPLIVNAHDRQLVVERVDW